MVCRATMISANGAPHLMLRSVWGAYGLMPSTHPRCAVASARGSVDTLVVVRHSSAAAKPLVVIPKLRGDQLVTDLRGPQRPRWSEPSTPFPLDCGSRLN